MSEIRARLASELGEDRFEIWFGTGTRLDWNGATLCIWADTTFRSQRLHKGLMTEIQTAVDDVLGRKTVVEFRVDAACGGPPEGGEFGETSGASRVKSSRLVQPDAINSPRGMDPSAPALPRLARGSASRLTNGVSRGRPFADLQTFVRGSCNQVAVSAAEMVLRTPGQMNPLFLCGPSGAGKTHLLEGIWTEVRRSGGRRIIYLSSEQFTTYFLQALRGSGLPSFRQKYRAVDLLILDDVQFFVGKQATITELLYTLDALLRESRQIVLAADRVPAELSQLGPELQNRLQGGLVCPLQPLDRATRERVLEHLAERRNLPLTEEMRNRIAERTPGDAR